MRKFLLLTLFNNKNLYNPNKSITFALMEQTKQCNKDK